MEKSGRLNMKVSCNLYGDSHAIDKTGKAVFILRRDQYPTH